ncbi:MAG: hypothetical protein J5715_08665 [Clostridiales bacterium]|nr:hypothetical protein [Clostridiales bacterium]
MRFSWLNIRDPRITDDLLEDFYSGNSVFDDFLKNKAGDWQDYSEAATYVFITSDEEQSEVISRIYGYVSINSTGLLYENSDGEKQYLSCAEIRMFAIHKSLRRKLNPCSNYSSVLFKMVLQRLYFMSTSVIGFRAIFLNANNEGYRLYVNSGFSEVTDYLAPETEEKLSLEGTTPLLLLINEGTTDLLFS